MCLHGLHAAHYGELAVPGSWSTHSRISTVQTSGACLAKIIMSLVRDTYTLTGALSSYSKSSPALRTCTASSTRAWPP